MFEVEPVAFVRGGRVSPEDDFWGEARVSIELVAEMPSDSLAGIDEFSHLEIVYAFDQVDVSRIVTGARHPRNNPDWPLVGIFAQRGKNRPNRIGCTIVRLIERHDRSILVEGLDAIDGTPVLDIKPVFREYLPEEPVAQPEWSHEVMRDYWAVRRTHGQSAEIDVPAPQPSRVGLSPRDRLEGSSLVAAVAQDMISYNGADVRRINHALKVTAFATLIAQLEGCEADLVEQTGVAALLHDIGIHEAEAKHGSAAGTYQELEGPAVAARLLDSIGVPDWLKERVCFLVGHHHTLSAIDGLDFQILVEADYLVNAFEDELSANALRSARGKVFRTAAGLSLFDMMFGGDGTSETQVPIPPAGNGLT